MSIKKTISSFAILFTAIIIFAGVSNAQQTDTSNAKLAKQAKISLEQARKTAAAAVAGNIEEEELEKEHGKLVYSFDIRNSNGNISEVQVDAKTGAIVSNQEDSKADEAKEKAADAKKAKKSSGKH